jgi:hypothetical protein
MHSVFIVQRWGGVGSIKICLLQSRRTRCFLRGSRRCDRTLLSSLEIVCSGNLTVTAENVVESYLAISNKSVGGCCECASYVLFSILYYLDF